MKKTIGILLLFVFAVSFVTSIAVTKAEALETRCIATCDGDYLYVCCPIYNKAHKLMGWDCYYDYTTAC